MSEVIGLIPKYYASKNQHIEQHKEFIKPIEDTLITCKNQHIETNKDFINTLEYTLTGCNTYNSTRKVIHHILSYRC